MKTVFKLITKKPHGENPKMADVIMEYNKDILVKTMEMLKEENAEVRDEVNAIAVINSNEREAERLRDMITLYISKSNAIYKPRLPADKLYNPRWYAFCTNFFEESDAPLSYANLRDRFRPPGIRVMPRNEEKTELHRRREKKEEIKQGDTKLKISYKKNEAAKTFLEVMGKTFLGIQVFKTYDAGDNYKHKASFVNHKVLLAFREKLRNLNYEDEQFRFTDLRFTTPSDENVKLIYSNIKKMANQLDEINK